MTRVDAAPDLRAPERPFRGRKAVRSQTELPLPPSDDEKNWYMGRQHRWLLVLQAFTLSLVVFSIGRFALSRPALWFFFIPAALYMVAMVVSLLSSTRKKRTSRFDHEVRVMTYEPEHWASVDVFLPTAGEPLEVLENTYRFVARLDWPAEVRVWVLDDAARPEVAELAAAAASSYRVRENRGVPQEGGQPALRLRAERRRLHRHLRCRLRAPPRLSSASSCRTSTTPRRASCSRRSSSTPGAGCGWLQRARRRDPGALLPLDPAVTRPVPGRDLRRHLRDLPAGRARRRPAASP